MLGLLLLLLACILYAPNQAIAADVNFKVSASVDDGYEATSVPDLYPISENLGIKTSLTDFRTSLIRFQNITIPKGSTVNNAYIKLYSWSTGYDDINSKIYANNVDNANNLTVEADIFGRSLTTAYVDWVQDSLGTGWITSPDITTVIQEIVNRSGWGSGNALAVIITADHISPEKHFAPRAWDYNDGVNGVGYFAAELYITYDAPPAAASSLGEILITNTIGMFIACGLVISSLVIFRKGSLITVGVSITIGILGYITTQVILGVT